MSRPLHRHRRAVLDVVRAGRPVTRRDLVDATGLSNATVSGVVARLLDDGVLVTRPGVRPSGRAGGRPTTELTLNPDLGAVVGIHLAHGDVRVLVAALDGAVLAERTEEIDVDHRPADTLEYVADTGLDLVAELGLSHRAVLGVGVAVAAPALLGTPLPTTPVLADWGEIDIAARLGHRTGLPVYVGNDATLGALAEWRHGTGDGTDNLVYAMVSEGVGAGLVLGGRLYQGETGAAGELGHVTVDPDGAVCRCGGRGCLETVVGSRALTTALAPVYGASSSFADLLRLAAAGDPAVVRLVHDAGRAVGVALAGVCTLLNPGAVVVGGTLAQTGAALLTGVREGLARTTSPATDLVPTVRPGRLGPRAEALGAVAAALTAVRLEGAEPVRAAV
ncbi:ROK family transcriptional regulator [Jatrophihabitans sp. YIM 134969]